MVNLLESEEAEEKAGREDPAVDCPNSSNYVIIEPMDYTGIPGVVYYGTRPRTSELIDEGTQ